MSITNLLCKMERTRLSDVYIFSFLVVAISLVCFSADRKVQNDDFPETDASGDDDDFSSSGDGVTESPITVSSETDHVQHQSHSPFDTKKIDSNLDSGVITIDPTDAFTGSIQAVSENDTNKHTDDKAILEQGKSAILSTEKTAPEFTEIQTADVHDLRSRWNKNASFFTGFEMFCCVPWSMVEEYSPSKMFMLAGAIAITVLISLGILWISFCVIFSLEQMKDYGKSKKKPENKSDIPLYYKVCMPVDNLAYDNVDANAYVYEEVVEVADSHKNEVPNADIIHFVEPNIPAGKATNNTIVQTVDICGVIHQHMTEEAAVNTINVNASKDVTSEDTTPVYPPVDVTSVNTELVN